MEMSLRRGLLLSLLAVSALLGQTFTGSIIGTVTDTSGAAIAGATVTAVNDATGESRTAQSSQVGEYSAPSLPPGDYRITVQFKGFKRFERTPIRVDVLQNVRVDIALEPGNVQETVEVTGQTSPLETASGALGEVIDNRQVVDLPLNGRDVMALVALTPGVTPGASANFGGVQVLQNVYAPG